jgi:hypothetical protein
MRRRLPRWAWPVVAWDFAWKALAIYKAVRRREWGWLLPLSTVNSAGLLPMWYVLLRRPPARKATASGEPGTDRA